MSYTKLVVKYNCSKSTIYKRINKTKKVMIMSKRSTWDNESEKRKKFQKKVERKVNELLVEYEQEYQETPWYQNTSNCILEGIIDELKSIDVSKIDYGAEGCYFGGRIEVLERIKKELIFGDNDD